MQNTETDFFLPDCLIITRYKGWKMEHLKAFQNYDICKYIYLTCKQRDYVVFQSLLYIYYSI